MREEFWDTQPHYGGHAESWHVIKAASEALVTGDLETARVLIESGEIVLGGGGHSLQLCYDVTGAIYEIPLYCCSDPLNLAR